MKRSRYVREMTGWKRHNHNAFLSSWALVNEDWEVNGDWTFNGDVQFEGDVSSTEPISAADPVDPQDLVTLNYFTTHGGMYQGVLNASAGIPYPAASTGMFWRISVAGTIGTTLVEVGDQVIAIADYAGGMDDTKFMIVQASNQITNVTYAQLQTLITTAKLEAGRKYRITNHVTAYNVTDGGLNTVIAAQLGTAETLIVVATGSDTLAKEAYSEDYPQDIIYYNPLCEAVERAAFIVNGDIGYVTAGSLVAGFTGIIEFRHDTKQNVSAWYDFRNIKFRRWAVDAAVYDPLVAYVWKDVCKSGVDGNIYKCVSAATGGGDPTVNTADWIIWAEIATDPYISWTADKASLYIGNITTTNLVIVPATYQDLYTFGSFYSLAVDTRIGRLNRTTLLWGYSVSLNNLVIKSDGFLSVANNIIGDDNYCNTFQSSFSDNTICAGATFNIARGTSHNIYHQFQYNALNRNSGNEGYLSYAIAGGSFNDNKIDYSVNPPEFGDTCSKLVIQSYSSLHNNAGFHNITECIFEIGSDIAGLDFSAATHIKTAGYNKTIFNNAATVVRLRYFDAADSLTVTDVNA